MARGRSPTRMATASTISRTRAQLFLVPFVVLFLIFFFAFNPFIHRTADSVTAAVFKAAPIWYLSHYVGMVADFNKNPLAVSTRIGLALSSIGDICLVWRSTLFLSGMFVFALAQAAYIMGLRIWLRENKWRGGEYTREFSLACFLSYLYVLTGMDSWLTAVCVCCYSALLFMMANLALQRHLMEKSEGSLAGAFGGVCFAVSDLMIAVDKWKFRFPFAEGLIMMLYYTGQACIAYGAVMSVKSKRNRGRSPKRSPTRGYSPLRR